MAEAPNYIIHENIATVASRHQLLEQVRQGVIPDGYRSNCFQTNGTDVPTASLIFGLLPIPQPYLNGRCGLALKAQALVDAEQILPAKTAWHNFIESHYRALAPMAGEVGRGIHWTKMILDGTAVMLLNLGADNTGDIVRAQMFLPHGVSHLQALVAFSLTQPDVPVYDIAGQFAGSLISPLQIYK